jgi:hypothetical protein
LPNWTPHRLDLFGLDIAQELIDVARRRLPGLASHIEVGNALDWQPGRRFDFARANLDAVPSYRRREFVGHLLGFSDRLIIGVFNEQVEERPTEELLRGWGYRIAGRSERTNRHKPAVDYRVLWIDAEEGR